MIDLEQIAALSRAALSEKYSEVVDAVRELERLRASMGWKLLAGLLESNASTVARGQDGGYFTSPEDVYKDQWMKGTANGLRRVPALLDESITYYTRFRDLIATMLTEGQGNEVSTESTDDGNGGSRGLYTGLDHPTFEYPDTGAGIDAFPP